MYAEYRYTQKKRSNFERVITGFFLILEVTKIAKFCVKNLYEYLLICKPCMYIFAKRFMKLCGHQKT